MTACGRPDCDGAIDDGFCDTCGRPALDAASSTPAPSTPASSTPAPSTPAPGTAATPVEAAVPVTPSGRTRSTSSRRSIGGGLVEIVATPRRDPAEAVLADPQVPERSRFCGRCDSPVGRAPLPSLRSPGPDPQRDRPGRTTGFCPRCGTRFSFVPDLAAGDVVAGQYEVLGCLAHGGLGWIHLAVDRAVDDRWVVLKGLIDTGDEAALAAATAERGFLARIEHPRIVRIYNVVEIGGAVYLVMEYVDGRSLRQMRDPRTPMPPAEALAYVGEALPALAHIHDLGLLYCDFKPDNVVQTGTELRLIDLGAVRRMDDAGGDVWGTVGYQAPEIQPNGRGPSVASDVYTVGRTLAVLTMNFDFSRSMTDRLPAAVDAPVLAEHDGFRRLLERATDTDPARRFASVGELAEQATGVLRQIVAAGADTPPPPRLSTVFGPPRRALAVDLAGPAPLAGLPAALPVLRTDPDDPAAAALSSSDPRGTLVALAELGRLDGRAVDSEQARRRAVLARAELGELPAAEALLAQARSGTDPRWAWVDAIVAAAVGDPARVRRSAGDVVDALPGEVASWFLLATAHEHAGDPHGAGRAHERVWRVDRAWISAAFGLARARLAQDDRAGAVAVLDEVPNTSVHHVDAAVAAIGLLAGTGSGRTPSRDELLDAGRRCGAVDLDVEARAELEAEVLDGGLRWVHHRPEGPDADTGDVLLACPLHARGIGFGLEARHRTRARYARSLADRIALVDRANDARPWTRV